MHRSTSFDFWGWNIPNRTVYNWFTEFQHRRTFLSDKFREDRPSTSVVATNVDAVREMIERDRHITYREIQAFLGIDMKVIHTILHDHLSVLCSRWISHNLTELKNRLVLNGAKKCSRNSTEVGQIWSTTLVTGVETWIYSYEPESKQQSTVWVFQNEPKPTKVVHSRSAAKQTIACFFGYTGHVTTVTLEDRRTVRGSFEKSVQK